MWCEMKENSVFFSSIFKKDKSKFDPHISVKAYRDTNKISDDEKIKSC